MSETHSFLAELKRRNVYKVAVALCRSGVAATPGTFNFLAGFRRVEARVGETQSAIDHLDQLLSPSGGETVSIAILWVWDPVRDDARFKALLAKHDASEKNAAR
jgi:hypothetical protein